MSVGKLNDTERTRLIALWGRDCTHGDITSAERTEMDDLAKRIKHTPWPPPIQPPGTPPPTIIIPRPSQETMIAGDPGVGGPEA